MSEILDLLLRTTDPVVALMLIGMLGYLRQIRRSLSRQVRDVRDRVERVEGAYIPDGGETLDRPDE